MMTRHVFLIGMPGSGKSSLGRRVGSNLRIPYLDTDSYISESIGCSIPEVFENYGEQAFRNAETNALIELTRGQPALISTGGGMVMRKENRDIMRNHGYIVLIDRPLNDIMSDIKLDRRPLLAQKGLGEVERLYRDRIETYRSAADYVLDNSRGYTNGMLGLERILKTLFAL